MELEELLDAPALVQYVDCFVQAGFDDVEFLLSMDREEWEEVLDAVSDEAAANGLEMRVGHRMQVISRLQREQVRRENAEAEEAGDMESGVGGANKAAGAGGAGAGGLGGTGGAPRHMPGDINRRDIDRTALQGDGGAIKVLTTFEGLSCLHQHWMLCIGLSAFSLCGALFLLLISSASGNLDNAEGDERDGGWKFIFVVMVVGFCVSVVAALTGVAAYYMNPADAYCAAPTCLTDCVVRDHPEAGAAACLISCLTCAGCGEIMSSCCDRPAEPEPPCCELGECYRPSCGCECDCCPGCGDVRSCLHVAASILMCRCKIQV